MANPQPGNSGLKGSLTSLSLQVSPINKASRKLKKAHETWCLADDPFLLRRASFRGYGTVICEYRWTKLVGGFNPSEKY